MKKIIFFIIISSLVLLLTGCWGAKNIESEVFVSALGLDYKDGKFVIYIQGLNFGNIAKQEGISLEPLPILIGEAKGESIQTAYSTLEQTTAIPLHLGHVQVILLSKNILKRKMSDVIEVIAQSPLLRYNIFLFGTEENLKDLLRSQSFFNYPQMYSIIYRPNELIEKNYSIPILRYNQFTSRYYRPIGTIMIPSLKINKVNFTQGKEEINVLALNGEYILTQQQYKGWLDKKDLTGLKWFAEGIQETTLLVGTEKKAVKIKNPKTKIVVLKGDKPSYKVVVKANAVLINNVDNKSINKIEKELNEQIKNDILTTIKKGEQIQADVLNISEKSYKYHLNNWNVNMIRAFNKQSIKDVEVKIHILESGNYKI